MEKIILASNSPRRKEILSKAGYVFDIYPSSYDEKISGLEYTDEIVENCAYSKAKDVHKNFPNHLIVASDTVVVLNGKILGKPKNQKDAHTMLQNLSSKTHFVATSICLIKENKVIKGIEKTYVTFRKLSEYDIEKYLNSQKPFDKAGSYGIQDEGFDFAIKLQGNLDCVIGFPVTLFKNLLTKM